MDRLTERTAQSIITNWLWQIFCPHQTLDSEASSHYNPEAQWMDVGTSLFSIPSVLFKSFCRFAYAASKKAKAFKKINLGTSLVV